MFEKVALLGLKFVFLLIFTVALAGSVIMGRSQIAEKLPLHSNPTKVCSELPTRDRAGTLVFLCLLS
jgi:hypothetical protein